mgnify:CR=1 FL=1
MLSIIIPAKELTNILFETISYYKSVIQYEYEILVVYDNISNDCKNNHATQYRNDNTIKILLSPSKGRINALNYGYTKSKGEIIKCIDADDKLLKEYFDKLDMMEAYSAHCHNAKLINDNSEIIGSYSFDHKIILNDYNYVLSNLKSPPRWVWSFRREIGDLIFPIPPELFAEDIWFSLIIKKHCDRIYHLNSSAYLYRQHDGGEWGGITNFSHEVMARRANWNLTVIPILLENREKLGIFTGDIFLSIINYYKVLLGKKLLKNILFAKTTNYYKVKLIVIMYLPKVASSLINLKWRYSIFVITARNIFYKSFK